ncbi:MAG: amidohydrolase family protein, partial [Nitrospinaceae bacterium]|nr:amidohydrolase family protein [Nitrospinaceae bacterium]NIR54530.1 amidohydrolase family protein [Nitrospinaceae bacterium]NIS84949.1 amidohydrolase family protein [Nitrospinaceae bacterium]NIT81763.1 amidohydrolase family protein [Nitrospinaceae bacterium]NIU44032.1 amidohydrolase family protein [Nitrospinaceae bacterium]
MAGNISRQQRFVDWIESVVLQNKALSWQARIEAMHREAKTLIASGVTTIGDYFSHPELLAEYQTLPFRQELFLETLGFQREVAESRAGEVAALLEEHPGHGNQIRLAVAPHAPYSVSPELFRRLKQLADQWHCRLSCHLAEVREEFQFLRTGRGDFLELLKSREVYDDQWSPPGVGPVTYLDQLGVLEGMTCIHLNHIDRRDLERLAQSHASAVFCPGSTRWF